MITSQDDNRPLPDRVDVSTGAVAYRDLVEQMQEGAVVLSGGGEILYANPGFAALVGEPLDAVIGSRIERFIATSDRDEFDALIRAGAGRRRSRLIGPGANVFAASLSLTTAGSPDGDRLHLIVTDLSALLEAASDRDRAEHASRTKDEFLATLAHELRNPLGAIGDAARLLALTQPDGGGAGGPHAVIARQVGHISHLIDDLLDVERVVSGKIRLDRQPFDLGEAVRRAAATFVAAGSLDRILDVSTESVWVDGDPIRIDQVLTNIITNAVKYTPSGGRIQVVLAADDGDAVLSIEDTGFGISPRLLPFIFDMYAQADRTLDRAGGGLGIGLALVRRLVELHDGSIVAWSAGEGSGTRFTVRLKRVPAGSGQISALPSSGDRRGRPRRVLLIEDSGDARQMMRRMLELAGHTVYDAPDGRRGLELLNVVRPDVGIIDISLPSMDGYQVARRIREDPSGRGMLLLALTGHDSSRAASSALEHGFDRHLVKPIDQDELTRLLNEGVGAGSFGTDAFQRMAP